MSTNVFNTKLNIFAACCGFAGLELALKLALGEKARVVGYIEREAYAAAALLARMEEQALDSAPIWCWNLEDFDGSPWRGCVDIFVAGYP